MLKELWLLIGVLVFLVGVISFISRTKHLLVTLLRLEFIVLALYFILFFIVNLLSIREYLAVVFLTIAVCEGALGLSLLVAITRTHGNDYFQSFRILQC